MRPLSSNNPLAMADAVEHALTRLVGSMPKAQATENRAGEGCLGSDFRPFWVFSSIRARTS